MEARFGETEHLEDFDNVLVVDENGTTLYYDLADLNILKRLGQRPEEFIGKRVTEFYDNLTEENSTLLTAIRTGEAVCNIEQELVTKQGSVYYSKSSTYPIKEKDRVVGAIEFSKHSYTKENLRYLDQFAGHKIFRKNHTIYTIDDLITRSPVMESIKLRLERIAQNDSTVLISGQTGTGKEVVAQAIHNLSDRFSGPFIAVNCGAFSPEQGEARLFGTVEMKDGNRVETKGLFEQAQGGTLFLDDIDILPPSLQILLLGVIESKTIRRIGDTKEIFVDIRILSATSSDLEELAAQQKFRQDLYYRLSVVPIELPSLVQRQEDIALFVEHFMDFYNERMQMSLKRIEPDVLECFMQYDWRGNIRELKNAIETAFSQAGTDVMTLEDIPKRIRTHRSERKKMKKDAEGRTLKDRVDDFEKSIIQETLEASQQVRAEAARRLGISKQLLRYKMDKYDIK